MNTRGQSWLLDLAVLLAFAGPASSQTLSRSPHSRTDPLPSAPHVACGPTLITESAAQDIVSGNSIACTDSNSGFTFENHYTRAFDLESFGIASAFAVCEVEIAVEAALSVAGSQPLTVALYSTDAGGFPGSVLTPIGTATIDLPDQDQSFAVVPVTGVARAGSALVVDVATENGAFNLSALYIGSNAAGQTAPGYLTAPDCGIATPTNLATLGHPDMHMVVNVRGEEVVTAVASIPVRVDAHSAAGTSSDSNGVFEAGETVQVETAWMDPSASSFSLTGLAENFAGPPGANYSIAVNGADYGTLAPLAASNCYDATGSCFQLQITGARPLQHWDATFDETVTLDPAPGGGLPPPTHTWTLHVGDSFPDVPRSNLFYSFIETIFHDGVTGGCASAPNYCPGDPALRKQMAVFVLKARQGPAHVPPPATGIFNDVPATDPFAPWIEELYNLGVVAGCSAPGGPNYCPNDPVLRQQMPVFLLRTLLGSSYAPPPCAGLFDDVPCPGLFTDWVEDLFHRGIAAGCGNGDFCPAAPNTRGQMAPFLVKTFGLSLYGP